ncbi:unnamed protein product [Periconia digitata]|uniref:Uncharacterized protein n=1 Tax=Periconia digitata TaxID=1303443 RepID=A0A9W4XQG5_9PLEO|nr:unnamed protein product [Periconia digitata]
MPNVYNLPFPKNYVRVAVAEPDLNSAFFRRVTDLPPYIADLKPLSLHIFVE